MAASESHRITDMEKIVVGMTAVSARSVWLLFNHHKVEVLVIFLLIKTLEAAVYASTSGSSLITFNLIDDRCVFAPNAYGLVFMLSDFVKDVGIPPPKFQEKSATFKTAVQ